MLNISHPFVLTTQIPPPQSWWHSAVKYLTAPSVGEPPPSAPHRHLPCLLLTHCCSPALLFKSQISRYFDSHRGLKGGVPLSGLLSEQLPPSHRRCWCNRSSIRPYTLNRMWVSLTNQLPLFLPSFQFFRANACQSIAYNFTDIHVNFFALCLSPTRLFLQKESALFLIELLDWRRWSKYVIILRL